ncbi:MULTISPECIES: acyl-CoA dehydrogenase family protein [Microbacterium]|jgi:glutaryl-CoA dehydrogenase|uniref:acyl-CoA dehydrogenase family protein n=1 Tax=Microbacterium TaxID=33882 RepID=UPI0027800364|nr:MULTISPECIES: acyl-CoA dehydrogenase family protein [Microbacterium]MDF2918697.1 acyl-CoA dehydrogenase [Microbacterium sp.]MDQ1076871.1 glutaryl-CoA dehydrogenase [Microbacterium sp. SORGH_AS_0969]MDQ1117107.1 glutaryl-CoA dehydrogenase [Microbacterium testaceum]
MNTVPDLLDFDEMLSAEERETRDRVRAFVAEHVRPFIADWYDRAHFPVEVIPGLAGLGVFGMHLSGYGCPGRTAVEYGLAAMELEAGDSGLRTLVSVQGSLAMTAIHLHGSEEQKQAWLPRMARGEAIGCFGLTEPGSGSDPASMTTRARRDGDAWVLDGAKRWIGLASIADIAVIWARTDEGVRGFLVPTDTPGFAATPIAPKMSMRASIQCDIALTDVRLPLDAELPLARGLGAAFACLNNARYGIGWGVVGAARDSYATALAYAGERRQFGQPIAAFQLTQQKLVDMALEIEKAQLVALRLGRLKDAGRLQPHQISVAKLANTRAAIAVVREARTILGGNGVTAEYSPMRHAANLESVRTYEGTDEIHTLVLGAHLTGIPAFRAADPS